MTKNPFIKEFDPLEWEKRMNERIGNTGEERNKQFDEMMKRFIKRLSTENKDQVDAT